MTQKAPQITKTDIQIRQELDNFEARHQKLKDARGELGEKFKAFWEEIKDAGYSKKAFEVYIERKNEPINKRLALEWEVNRYLTATGNGGKVINDQLLLDFGEDKPTPVTPDPVVDPDGNPDYGELFATEEYDPVPPEPVQAEETDAERLQRRILELVDKGHKKIVVSRIVQDEQGVSDSEVELEWNCLVGAGRIVKDGRSKWSVATDGEVA
ncbi:MAG: hypothetical protein AB7S38_28875 [Vulcanimicrobiota bacterium]